eukprot:4310342-Pleurochrysis_carterae.AAC.1
MRFLITQRLFPWREFYNFGLPSTMAGTFCFPLASLLAFIVYMGIMHFFYEGEGAVAILPYLALAIVAI